MAAMQLCQAQKNYGKTESDFKTIVKAYLAILSDFTVEQILDAMRRYMRMQSDIPAPADLARILAPNEQENLSPVVYAHFRRKVRNGEFLTSEERKYCEKFERIELKKV